MCIACGWGRYRELFKTDAALPGIGPRSRRRLLQVGATLAASGFAAEPVAAQSSPGAADVAFRGGPIFTANSLQPWAQAVAVQGKRLLYVGDEAGLGAHLGPATRVVELRGRLLLPGFVEAHIHPISGSVITRGIDLQFDTREETLSALRAHRERIGRVDLVRGFGWRYAAFPDTGPRKEDLDAIWPETPVLLVAIDGHGAWVNSAALAAAGITRATPDPVPGFSWFQRDAAGAPTGYLVEVPAAFQVISAISPFTPAYVRESLEEWVPRASAAGITSLFDAGMVIVPEPVGFETYQDLERRGKLPFRVVGCTYHNNPAQDPLPGLRELRRRFHSELVRASVLKLNLDGGDGQRTAAMLAPYSDAPDERGETLLPPELFKELVRRADREGLDIHVHSYGDRATRLSLDAFEAAARVNPPRDRRHALAHILHVDPADIPRFGQLGVTAQYSIQWAVPDPGWRQITRVRLGPERASTLYQAASVLREGGNIAFGTDWPAAGHYSTLKPLDAIEVAVTRRELGKPGQMPLPPAAEALTLAQAIRAATLGPAYQIGLEREVGSIEVGKLADLVLLERNLFEVPPHEIHSVKVDMTMMNGVVRHG